jgi:hypothetical protein
VGTIWRANVKNLSSAAKFYIYSTIIIGLALIVWMFRDVDWANLGLYELTALASIAQTFKVDGPNDKSNYNIAWFVYGFTFIALGAPAALFVLVFAHFVEWIRHKYPWYIQSFNIAAHAIMLYITSLVYDLVSQGSPSPNLNGALAIAAASLVFVLGNHLLVGVVIKLARGQSFAESGVFGSFTIFLDFTVLSMGAVTALIWDYNPCASILNILPLYLLYNALRVPALERQVENLEKQQVQNATTT